MEQGHLEVFCSVKNFINKISDYSDLYSFGYLVKKVVIIDKLYLKDFDYNE